MGQPTASPGAVAQLRAVGWDKDAVARRVRAGRLRPVFAEVYGLGGPPQTDRERWMAATLSYGRGAELSHSAAAELYELLRYPLGEIHVTTLRERRSRQGIIAHHRRSGSRARFVDGIPVTSPEQTVLDRAATVRNNKAYRRVVRQAQATGLTTHARLAALSARHRGARGVTRLKRELAHGPSPTRSATRSSRCSAMAETPSRTRSCTARRSIPGSRSSDRGGGAVSASRQPDAQADDLAEKARLERRGVRVVWVT